MDAAYTGQQIAEKRKSLGLTQKRLAEQLNVTDKAVSKWERGLNFPDLGLMEELARVLETTPTELLGLQAKERDEIVSSMAEIYEEQAAQAQRHLCRMGWGCVLGAVLLVAAHNLLGDGWKEEQYAYQLLEGVSFAALAAGLWLLVRYGEIRRWEIADWLILYGALFPILIWCGIAFLTGYGPHEAVSVITVALTASMTQLLFRRIFRPKAVKALPFMICIGYMIWKLTRGAFSWYGALGLLSCGISLLPTLIRKKR